MSPEMNIQLVLIEISALPRDHREHVLPDVLGDLKAVLRRDAPACRVFPDHLITT